MVAGANEWLHNHTHFEVFKCETLDRKCSSLHHVTSECLLFEEGLKKVKKREVKECVDVREESMKLLNMKNLSDNSHGSVAGKFENQHRELQAYILKNSRFFDEKSNDNHQMDDVTENHIYTHNTKISNTSHFPLLYNEIESGGKNIRKLVDYRAKTKYKNPENNEKKESFKLDEKIFLETNNAFNKKMKFENSENKNIEDLKSTFIFRIKGLRFVEFLKVVLFKNEGIVHIKKYLIFPTKFLYK